MAAIEDTLSVVRRHGVRFGTEGFFFHHLSEYICGAKSWGSDAFTLAWQAGTSTPTAPQAFEPILLASSECSTLTSTADTDDRVVLRRANFLLRLSKNVCRKGFQEVIQAMALEFRQRRMRKEMMNQ